MSHNRDVMEIFYTIFNEKKSYKNTIFDVLFDKLVSPRATQCWSYPKNLKVLLAVRLEMC